MRKILVLLVLAILLAVAALFLGFACSSVQPPQFQTMAVEEMGASDSFAQSMDSSAEAALRESMGLDRPRFPGTGALEGAFASPQMPAATAAPSAASAKTAAVEAPAQPSPTGGNGSPAGEGSSQLALGQRQVISTAVISVQVDDVPSATARVRGIAESLGGFVQRMSSSGDRTDQNATAVIRVPQEQFFPALEGVEALGKMLAQDVGQEDVSEQLVDLNARLRSFQREEESLLKLLDRANEVSEILVVERELNRVRSEVERLQGHLDFLERQVALATITVTLFPRGVSVAPPPSASLSVETSRVSEQVEEVLSMVQSLGGKVDVVQVSAHDGREWAEVAFRVFPADFNQATQFLEDLGEVRRKDFRVEAAPEDAEKEQPEEPNAPVNVTLREGDPPDVMGIIIIIIVAAIVLALAAVAGAAALYIYRSIRHRRRDRYAV